MLGGMRTFILLSFVALPLALAEPTVPLAPVTLAQPGASGMHGIGVAAPACTPAPCADGDQGCLQASFHEALACLTTPGAPIPPADAEALRQTHVFRAHGDGLVLYGTFGRPVGPGALRAVARAVD